MGIGYVVTFKTTVTNNGCILFRCSSSGFLVLCRLMHWHCLLAHLNEMKPSFILLVTIVFYPFMRMVCGFVSKYSRIWCLNMTGWFLETKPNHHSVKLLPGSLRLNYWGSCLVDKTSTGTHWEGSAGLSSAHWLKRLAVSSKRSVAVCQLV